MNGESTKVEETIHRTSDGQTVGLEAAAGALDEEFRTACASARCDEPWVGGFSLEVGPKTREYRVGRDTRPSLRVIAWQHPYARAFFEGAPGGRFTLERDEAEGYAAVDGRLARRIRVASRERALQRVELELAEARAILVRDGDGFVDEARTIAARAAHHGLPDVLALLTPEQYRLITSASGQPVIIQGRAGSGKTTVALHRVAWLTHPEASPGVAPVDPRRVLVVMFNRALSAFVETSLAPLGLDGVALHTFHAWALEAIRRAYKGDVAPSTSKIEGREVATALKRQLGMLSAIEAMVARQTEALFAWLDEKSTPYGGAPWVAELRASSGPIVPRLVALRRRIIEARDAATTTRERGRLDQLVTIVYAAKERMTLYKEELLRLLTDKELLRAHLRADDAALDTLAAYQRALQGEGGTDRRPGPHVGFEDFALLLRLIQIKNGGLADKDTDDVFLFDHLVIDEAQDFGAVELATLFAAVRSRTGVTIVGDLNQKIIPESEFIGWDGLAAELGLGGAEVAKLEVGHRSTRPIVALAGTILPDGAPSGRAGVKPALLLVDEDEAVAREVARLAGTALRDAPDAHVCVVCGSTTRVAALRPALAAILGEDVVRVGHNAAFTFGPGVTVTNVRQVKGLEFDVVIVVNPDAASYPDSEQGRRWLYTVVTRAKERLAFVSAGDVTALLTPATRDGLLATEDLTEVVPVVLTDSEEPF